MGCWSYDEVTGCAEATRTTRLLVKDSRPPVPWPMVKMHDVDDVDALRLDTLQQTLREFRNEKTPELLTERRASRRRRRQVLVGAEPWR
jgi:hypothetical protein